MELTISINKLLLRSLSDRYLFIKNFVDANYFNYKYFYSDIIYMINRLY